MATEIGF